MLHLQIIHPESGLLQSQQLDVQQQRVFLIGRHPSCPIVLDRPEVSRVHGQFSGDGDRAYYRDLGSTDGSKINNQEIAINSPQVLHPGDTVQIGEFVILISAIRLAPSAATPMRLRCIQIIDQTHDVKTFRWINTTGEPFDYLPGQFVMLELDILGRSYTRCYSISSSPSRSQVLEFTVKRVGAADRGLPVGVVSNWLHDHIHVGFELVIQGIAGNFTCDRKAGKILLLSAGSGITPMLSMARWICDLALPIDVVLLHSARSPQDVIAQSELTYLNHQNPHLQIRFTVTQKSGKDRWDGLTGRINAAMLRDVPDLLDRTVYVCGNDPFMANMKHILLDLGLPPTQYQEESFGSAPIAHSPPSSQTAPTIEFRQAQTTVTPQSGETILAAGLRAGITMMHGCRMGACGICRIKLHSGAVTYTNPPIGLNSQEPHQNSHQNPQLILPCIAIANDRVVLE